MFCSKFKKKKTEERISDSDEQDEKEEKGKKMETATGDAQPHKLVQDPGAGVRSCDDSVGALSRPSSSKGMFRVGIVGI